MLGYPNGALNAWKGYTTKQNFGASVAGEFIFRYMSCSGTESSVADCGKTWWYTDYSKNINTELAGIKCKL